MPPTTPTPSWRPAPSCRLAPLRASCHDREGLGCVCYQHAVLICGAISNRRHRGAVTRRRGTGSMCRRYCSNLPNGTSTQSRTTSAGRKLRSCGLFQDARSLHDHRSTPGSNSATRRTGRSADQAGRVGRVRWARHNAGARHPRAAHRRRARRGGWSGSVEAQAPTHLVLVHDRVGVPAGDARVVGEPMSSFFAAEERGTRFEPVEPLSEAAAGNDRNACDEASVQIR
jgi:hypothetical protein